jgi:hypothetical protein
MEEQQGKVPARRRVGDPIKTAQQGVVVRHQLLRQIEPAGTEENSLDAAARGPAVVRGTAAATAC